MNKKKFIIVIVFIIVIAAIRWAYGSFTNSDRKILSVYGSVELRDVQLSFTEQERITELLVEEGDYVKKGQILARLNDRKLQISISEAEATINAQDQLVKKLSAGLRPQEIRQAQARLEASEARLKNGKLLVKRLEKTSDSGASTKQKLDDARAQMDIAEADIKVNREALILAKEGFRQEDIQNAKDMLKAKEARLAFLNERLNDTVLKAPADGIIQSRILEVGEITSPSNPVFIMALKQPKWIRAYLPEPELGKVHEGMKATVLSDSYPDIEFHGTVGFISPQAEFTPKSVQTEELRTQLVYEIRINVEDASDQLRLGMPVTVKIHQQEISGK